jgi:hypothetical protein
MRPGLAALLLLLLGLGGVAPATAQVDVTAEPAMTRGLEGAPVTIVEFSDFE